MAINIFAPPHWQPSSTGSTLAQAVLVQVTLMNNLSTTLGITTDNFLVKPCWIRPHGISGLRPGHFTAIYFNKTKSGLNYKAVGGISKAAATWAST